MACGGFVCCFAASVNRVDGVQDAVPAENSVISMLQKANNKATGSGFTPL